MAEGSIRPEVSGEDERFAEERARARHRRCARGTATFASVLCLCASALAQDPGAIDQRIERTFALVIGNTADLAVPLTRRALARRSYEDNSLGILSYSEPDPAAGESLALPEPEAEATASTPPAAAVAEQPTDDEDIARLPRPRPARAEEGSSGASAVDAPLDLVAGAPVPSSEIVAAAETQPPAPAVSPDQPILPPASDKPAPPELVASGSCLAPTEVVDKDGDFKRNADALSGNAFCIAEAQFKERGRSWTLQSIKTSRPGPLWAVMHDDEDMSFDDAVEALKAYGGTLVSVDTGGKRNMDGIDPNRNFSADGIGCKKLGNDEAPEFTAFFRDLMSDEPIIALHNNYDGHVPTGGLGHVSMASVPKEMKAFPAPDRSAPLAGDHDLVLLVSATPLSDAVQQRAAALNAKGVNVVVEQVADGQGDCSLSNYALFTGHTDYLNVTVDHDESDKQRRIIDMIMAGRNPTVATQ